MKFTFNILRPIIFFCCGLGYLPLQSADYTPERNLSSDTKVEKVVSKKNAQEPLEQTLN